MNGYITSCTSDNYVPGVIALYNSIRLSKCNYDFIVIIPDDLSDESKRVKHCLRRVYLADIKKMHLFFI